LRSFLKRNYFFGDVQVRGNHPVDRCLHFLCFVISRGSVEVIVALGLLFDVRAMTAMARDRSPDNTSLKRLITPARYREGNGDS